MSSKRNDSRFEDGRPTVQELRGDHPLAQIAKRWWLRERPATFNPSSLKKEVYDVLEKEQFGYKSLLVLENLQFLEKYLWPNFSDEASDFHTILVAIIVNVKRREDVPVWDHLSNSPANFSVLFRRILTMAVDAVTPLRIRIHLLSFIVAAFQSLDSGLVRKEIASLVSIGVWHNLSSPNVKDELLEKYPQTKKVWRAAGKRYDAADEEGKARLRFERSWLYQMVINFLNMMWKPSPDDDPRDIRIYCERFIELLCDLESQLPTRRYINLLLKDMQVLTAIKLSPLFVDTEIDDPLREHHRLLDHYVNFAIDDLSGTQLSPDEVRGVHNGVLAKLQRVAFKHYQEKLTLLAMANYGILGTREELTSHFVELTDEELIELCQQLGLRTSYPKSVLFPVDRPFLTEMLLSIHERRRTFQEQLQSIPILPNEKSLDEVARISEAKYDGTRPLPLPKLNLQYLTVGDFLWRSFILYRHEAYFGIRRNIEDALQRLKPKIRYPTMETTFHGYAKMALIINRPSILEVLPPRVGEEKPALVRAEISLDLTRVSGDTRGDWEGLRPDDIVFLMAVKGADEGDKANGSSDTLSLSEQYGIKCLRTASVISVLDRDGKPLRMGDQQVRRSGGMCRLHVNLDADMYKADSDATKEGKPDIYDSINLIVRRKGRENNFKPILESVQELSQSDLPLSEWLNEVFLGFGDPASATNLPGCPKSIDFRDTFLDWEHLASSFPDKKLIPTDGTSEGCEPPYIITTPSAPSASAPKSKKRRRDAAETNNTASNTLEISTYKLPNMGPYPQDVPRRNQLRYTPSQISAITSGTKTGLTIVVGPPGTGKTDVATQVISNIYHNFPQERTLLVAHSNQALNQLFEKITRLDIDERHLLRLGHGEEGVTATAAGGASWGKKGRVESFMDNRQRYLTEVDRLAANFGAPGAHGDSCETAGYFNQVYVLPAWEKFEAFIGEQDSEALSAKIIYDAYPFNAYFSNAPKPMFSETMSTEEALEVAQGGYRHIKKIFEELEDIRPFELLRTQRDRQNYLLIKEARIVAMTSTHAAIKRREISRLGFTYDSLILEESAQITELETFIPLCLQAPRTSDTGSSTPTTPLHRIVLLGDHLQNSPILQNIPLRLFSNLSQSLFTRLIRISAPTITLHTQARCRPEIADLFAWRYDDLTTLPSLLSPQFKQFQQFRHQNPGFKYTYQFIDVPDYKGQGESQPQDHFIQNLGEAEYAVALYMYMRLLGYPRERISILAPYAGQRELIREVVERRCVAKGGLSDVFGWPKSVTTVDRYQGEQNDYVILSLTRTKHIGYLRDMRRMTVALSRARLGLYVLGRKEVFESCFELQEAWKRLTCSGSRTDKLALVTGEMYPASKRRAEGVEDGGDVEMADGEAQGEGEGEGESGGQEVEMEGVEHIGRYVYEMTNTRLRSEMRVGTGRA